jgi:NAD(P)-dependent dehydrogenase (short-subunit alcohol dehydrogenase family)
MVDRLALTQLVPVVHRRDPPVRGATATSLAQRRAGGPCGPTGASVSASRSRCRPAQIEGTGWDIGYAVRFLLSVEARYITGQTLVVDGGATLVGPARAPE